MITNETYQTQYKRAAAEAEKPLQLEGGMKKMEQLELDLRETTELKPARILMLSGYLTIDPEKGKNWKREHGYDPNNFHDIETLISNTGRVVQLKREGSASIFELNELGDLAISGSLPNNEFGVQILSGSGLIVARYSKFYGGPSGYSQRLPEQGGYSLDIPKNIGIVKKLLEYDPFLEAVLKRDSKDLRKSLEELNKKIEKPVIATPFLERCLKITPQ